MPLDVDRLLSDRGSVHGDWEMQSALSDALWQIVSERPNFNALKPYQREALKMILIKISRIVHGDPNYPDHWVDIVGYASLVLQRMEE